MDDDPLPVTATLFAYGPHLRYVARAHTGAGVANIDEDALACAMLTNLVAATT